MESDRDYRKLAHHAEGLYFTSQFREQELEERFGVVVQKVLRCVEQYGLHDVVLP